MQGAGRVPGLPPLRDWQTEAIDATRVVWHERGSTPLVVGTPACGKTRFGSEVAWIAVADYDCRLVLCVSPTVNVKENWRDCLNDVGLVASADVDNQTLQERKDRHWVEGLGDYNAICITYAQLARDKELFAEMLRRYDGLLIADEPHHADENKAYGDALDAAAEQARHRLSVTGTPFNTRGMSLSMVPSEIKDGKRCALSAYTYPYGRAITEQVCRPVEFITVMGRGDVTYHSPLQEKTWRQVTDLAKGNKTDRLTTLLTADGEFFSAMLETGIKALLDIKKTDPHAAMMIAVMDVAEGRKVKALLDRIFATNQDYPYLVVAEVYHDTPGAHRKLDALRKDHTDIVIAVRMISEGVDVPRLRVGVYATNYLTRLFFIQLTGRFIRWEDRLDDTQFAKVIIPAHILLVEWAHEIENMITEAVLPKPGNGGDVGGSGGDPSIIVTNQQSVVTSMGAILRGDHEPDISPAAAFFRRVPDAVGRIPDFLATVIERAYRGDQATGENYKAAQSHPSRRPGRDLHKENSNLVGRIVRMIKAQGVEDEDLYAKVNARANRAVGLRRIDALTTDDQLTRRAAFLGRWFEALLRGEPFNEVN